MILKKILHFLSRKLNPKTSITKQQQIDQYIDNGRIPWSKGYIEYKTTEIERVISDNQLITDVRKGVLPSEFGVGLDERIVEYLWLFSKLDNNKSYLLDAGSTLNFPYLIEHKKIEIKKTVILTFAPESHKFNDKGVSYVYADLRDMPLKDNLFDVVISQSTIEHIDMDNSIYGYDIENSSKEEQKSYEYIGAIKEMIRVLKHSGKLLLTFPYGKFENHGFFQQFDSEMVDRILEILKDIGDYKLTFFRYTSEGWVISDQKSCNDTVSFNPHTGKGKLDDGAAHCRCVCCIDFNKDK